MIPFIIRQALRFRAHVVTLAMAIAGWGVWATTQQKVDAYPDISAQMVQVITTYPGRASEDVERQVTIPVEIAMRNVPRVATVRSRTIFGLSVVQMIFEEGVENYWARQRVQEKLGTLQLPGDASPDLGPMATAYGEIFRYEIVSDGGQNAMDLRTLNDWVVIPRLLRVPGVADVSNFGGYAKEYSIVFKPAQLQRYGLSVHDVVAAVQSNNASAGGSVIPRGSMSFVIRGKGALQSLEEMQTIFVKSVAGTPVYVRDVADVQLGYPVPSGMFSKDRVDESLEGIVLMRKGENPSEVLASVNDAVAELNASRLPEGARIKPYYDRTLLVRSTMYTVTHSVLTGVTLVVLVLVFFLGRPAVALLVALTIPFSLLVAMALMRMADIPVGLLSIGAIDFGIIVDGSVIMAENIARRVGELPKPVSRRSVLRCIREAALEVEKALFLSIFLIIAAYLPLLTLRSIEGLLFRPLALTIIFALAGALFFALVVTPVLATFLLRFGYDEWENPILKWFKPMYAHWVEVLLRWRYQVAVGTAGVFLVLMAFVAPRLGTQFLPYMDEGVIWVRVNCPEGTSLTQTASYGGRLREIALEFPEVDFIVVQTGRNDSGTDPFLPSRMEMMIGPKPVSTRFHTKRELLAALRNRFGEEFPTLRFNFTQPIIDSVTEDTNGTSANLAVELLGDDPAVLLVLAGKVRDLLRTVPGAADVAIEQEGPQPQLVIEPDRALCARYGVNVDDVNQMITTALGGSPIGALYEGERRFDITAKFDREALHSPQAIGRLPVYAVGGTPIPLGQIARIDILDGQTIIARENGRRRITVRTDIVGRDQGGFVKEAQARFAKEIAVPSHYSVEWLGMFENLARAREHFTLLIPVTVGAIFVVLLMSFRSIRTALILLLPIPFALMGATVALYVRGMNIDVSTGVGFATVFAVSIMDGVLMVRGILAYRQQGHSIDEAIVLGRLTRLRPILMTSTVAILGLLPASLATGLGSDVQRPLATVIIWGLSSSTLLTLFVVPVFYRIFVPVTLLRIERPPR
ncbi:CusA/CzcA family heavy metal efflux RND transporter [Pendulispora rubella]|uniref:CusA/CzcA family heavy metal efflux RND transporter n=1 Tax=Pendulispora rubella TaxID=2741070 RepID=A0ABZ2LMI5_9BACT